MHFADSLTERMRKLNSRLVIGIDPDPRRLFGEGSILAEMHPGWSRESLLDEFCACIIEVARSKAAAVKPQAAFFESMGLMGWRSFEKCLKLARKAGIPVILDAKRGDIGNTASAYASAYLDPSSSFFADALTVNPYLGPDTVEVFAKAAEKSGCGIFVLVKTSNPGSGTYQDVAMDDGRPLYMKVADTVRELAASSIGSSGYSNVGAVAGATFTEEMRRIRAELPNSVLLVPGYGAQGGTAEDVIPAFRGDGLGAVVSSSRAIIFAYEKSQAKTEDAMMEAIYKAAESARLELERAAEAALKPSI